jgi:hypothetical protein
LLKGVQGCLKVIVVLNQDWDSALDCFVHCLAPPLILTQKVKGAFPCRLIKGVCSKNGVIIG